MTININDKKNGTLFCRSFFVYHGDRLNSSRQIKGTEKEERSMRSAAAFLTALLMLLTATPAAAETTAAGCKSIPAGHWEKTEELSFPSGEQQDGSFKIYYENIEDRYPAGGNCRLSVRIFCPAGKPDVSDTITGSICFADVKEGDDAFGQQVTVREYFHKERSTTYPPFEMHDYGTGKEQGRYGSNSDQAGAKEFYYKSFCLFPRTPSEGDEICLVAEVSDGTGKGPGRRKIWKFVFRADPEDPAGGSEEIQEEETHPENSPEWIREEYPGHWDLTGISFIGGDLETGSGTGTRVITRRSGVDLQDMSYTFEGEGEPFTVIIPDQEFEPRYYAGDFFYTELEVFCSSGEEKTPGTVICAIGLCRAEFGAGKYGVKITPEHWFTRGYPERDVETFGPLPHNDTMHWRNDLPRGFLGLDCEFPEGTADGEKIWLVYGVMDSLGGDNRMYNLREYTWTSGPDVVWTYNPPMY